MKRTEGDPEGFINKTGFFKPVHAWLTGALLRR